MINERSARAYCSEDPALIERCQEAISDPTRMWEIHHRLEVQGQFVNSVKLLKRCGMYWRRPASELIFLTKSQHHRLHGLNPSDETRKKMSKSRSGENNGFFGKTHTEEARKKMSAARSGGTMSGEKSPLFGKHHSAETRKRLSEVRSGEKSPHFDTHWHTDGVKTVRAKSCPPGFHPGRH